MRAPAPSASAACRYREQVAAPRGDFPREHRNGDAVGAGPSRCAGRPNLIEGWAPDPFEGLRRELPSYIRACHENPDPLKPVFWLYTWDPSAPAEVKRAPYTCRSWRCPFGCAQHEGHVLFARMQEAFADTPPEHLVFVVLTLDGEFHDLTQHDLPTLYKTLGKRLEKFRKRLRRLLRRRLGLEAFGTEWVAVIEQHASGVPHVNLLVKCRSWARFLEGRFVAKRARGMSARSARLLAGTQQHRDDVDGLFLELLSACGFGYRSSAEVARNAEAAIGYIGKVAGRADHTAGRVARKLARERAKLAGSTVGEATKNSQLPLRAPKGFRRLRSGVGFLPKRRKSDKTGMIVKRYRTWEGDELARPLVVTKRPDVLAMQAVICDTEQKLCWQDEAIALRRARARAAGLPTRVPRRDLITVHRLDPAALRAAGLEVPGQSRAPPEPEPEPMSRAGPSEVKEAPRQLDLGALYALDGESFVRTTPRAGAARARNSR